MTILVTAATGHLGRLVIESLLARGTDPGDVVATARDVSRLADVADRGVRVAELDYARPETIAPALEGVDALLLVSASAPGGRVQLHANVIDAAAAAGVRKLVYTSAPHATTGSLVVNPDHKGTEEAIAASGVPAVILRNNWYNENYLPDLQRAAETGVLAKATGDGRVASASRADFAEAAAVALLEDEHIGAVYELAGDVAWTSTDLAVAMTEALGRPVEHHALTREEQTAVLEGAGLDTGTVWFVTTLDADIRAGELADADGTLSRLIGRPTTPILDTLVANRP